jgi:micrococcal nuclease
MQPYIFRATGIRAIDGDTIECEVDLGFGLKTTQRFRLWGVDTPEKTSPIPQVKEAAYEAQEFTANFVEGKSIMLQTYKTDDFGRYLAKVFVPQGSSEYVCLNEMLVLEGFARPYMEETDLLK